MITVTLDNQKSVFSPPSDANTTVSRISSYTDGEFVQMHTRQSDRHLWVQGGVLRTGRLSYS